MTLFRLAPRISFETVAVLSTVVAAACSCSPNTASISNAELQSELSQKYQAVSSPAQSPATPGSDQSASNGPTSQSKDTSPRTFVLDRNGRDCQGDDIRSLLRHELASSVLLFSPESDLSNQFEELITDGHTEVRVADFSSSSVWIFLRYDLSADQLAQAGLTQVKIRTKDQGIDPVTGKERIRLSFDPSPDSELSSYVTRDLQSLILVTTQDDATQSDTMETPQDNSHP